MRGGAHPECDSGGRRDGGVANGEVFATDATLVGSGAGSGPIAAVGASVRIEFFGFAGASFGGIGAEFAPSEGFEVVFDADFVDEGENFVLPLFHRGINHGDGDGILAQAVVGAGGNRGGASAFDDRVATSFIAIAKPSAGGIIKTFYHARIGSLPIHFAEIREAAAYANVDVGGGVNGDGIFVPEFAGRDSGIVEFVARSSDVIVVANDVVYDGGAGIRNRVDEGGFASITCDDIGTLIDGAELYSAIEPDSARDQHASNENSYSINR